MFKHPLRNILHFAEMHTHCPVCGLRFEVEPGFFFGAMYISYAFSVAAMVAVGVLLYFFFDNPSTLVYTSAVIITLLLLLPFSFRYSRALFLYWFGGVRYQAEEQG